MAFYKKKPVVIEARLFDGAATQTMDVYHWIEENTDGSFDPWGPTPPSGVSIDPETGEMLIATLEGRMRVSLGDYVIKGVQGEFYPCKPEIFHQTYETV